MEHAFSGMEQMSRRTLIKLGVGSAATAVAAGVPLAHLASGEDEVLRFSGMGGQPEAPLPSYATHVVEGSVDLKDGTGTVTSRVLAGHPGAASSIGLPGLARIMQIGKVSPASRAAEIVLAVARHKVGRLPNVC